MSKNQYLVRAGRHWGVRAEGRKRLPTICHQQGEAMAAGREIARNQHSKLRIQGRDGKLREAELRQRSVSASWLTNSEIPRE